MLAAWKLDRLSRSFKDLLHLLEGLKDRETGFLSITEHIDTTTPAGRMMLQTVGALAEFELEMICERTAGLEKARAQGRIGGRRPKPLRPRHAPASVTGRIPQRAPPHPFRVAWNSGLCV